MLTEDMAMDDKELNEKESLELITRMIDRARQTELRGLNFIRLYGGLGVLMMIVQFIWHDDWLNTLWIPVPLVAYLVPFVRERMWKKQRTVMGRIVKTGWGKFTLLAVIAAIYGAFDVPQHILPLMALPLVCAMFMLSGMLKSGDLLGIASGGLCFCLVSFGKDEIRGVILYGFFIFFLSWLTADFGLSRKKRDKKTPQC